jgi:[ribosomal protein S18]-alanine N-acetyltransferase
MRRLPYSPRPATEADLSQVARIESLLIKPPWSAEAFRQELEKPSSHFWVVTDNETDEKVAAYCVFSFPAEQAHLVTFAVDPQFHRQGLGIYLLRQMLSFVMRKNGESMILEVRKGNAAAVALYQKVGFVVIRTIPKFYPDGEDGFVMLYKTEQNKLSGDPDDDFDRDPEPGEDGKQNFN